jgi:hypothetical protein
MFREGKIVVSPGLPLCVDYPPSLGALRAALKSAGFLLKFWICLHQGISIP